MICQSQSCRKNLKNHRFEVIPGSRFAHRVGKPVSATFGSPWQQRFQSPEKSPKNGWQNEGDQASFGCRRQYQRVFSYIYIYTYIYTYIYIHIYIYPRSVNHLQCKSGGLQTSGMPQNYRRPFWDVLTLLITDLDKMYPIKSGGYQMNTTYIYICVYIYTYNVYIYTHIIYIILYNYIYQWPEKNVATHCVSPARRQYLFRCQIG